MLPDESACPVEDKKQRVQRLIWLIQEIRNDPSQDLQSLLSRAGISRSQFYKDKNTLAELGFVFDYQTKHGFIIVEDRLSPAMSLTLSDRILVMFALGHLSSTGDGHLAAKALSVGRKLASGLEEPFRKHVLDTFDSVVIQKGYGCRPEVLDALEDAVKERKRVAILYRSMNSGETRLREVDPFRIYFLQRTLYLYAREPLAKPEERSFRISRIERVNSTGIGFAPRQGGDRFYERLRNAFSCFLGDEAHEVILRFQGQASIYVSEVCWHHSQRIEEEKDGSIIFHVKVAEPREVLRWAMQFGDEFEIIVPEWLKVDA